METIQLIYNKKIEIVYILQNHIYNKDITIQHIIMANSTQQSTNSTFGGFGQGRSGFDIPTGFSFSSPDTPTVPTDNPFGGSFPASSAARAAVSSFGAPATISPFGAPARQVGVTYNVSVDRLEFERLTDNDCKLKKLSLELTVYKREYTAKHHALERAEHELRNEQIGSTALFTELVDTKRQLEEALDANNDTSSNKRRRTRSQTSD
jgi:hypothetical protein